MQTREGVRLVENDHSREPVLVERFFDIKTKPDIEPALEEFKPLLDTEESRLQSFEEAKKAFLFVLDQDMVQSCLEAPETNKETHKFLKRVRRFGLILRAQYKFLDKNHNSPKNLQEFVSALGTYNDEYYLEEKTVTASQIALFLKQLSPESLSIDVAGKKNVDAFSIYILDKINNALAKDQLPMKEFHKLRRAIRFCGDLLQVAAAKNYGSNIHWLFTALHDISVELGHTHDVFVQQKLKGEIDYNSSIVNIDPHIQKSFQVLQPMFEKVLGLENN